MASPGNRHCANCIGTRSFPVCVAPFQIPGGNRPPAPLRLLYADCYAGCPSGPYGGKFLNRRSRVGNFFSNFVCTGHAWLGPNVLTGRRYRWFGLRRGPGVFERQ